MQSYWRTKRGAEVDFVLAPGGGAPVATECKWTAGEFDAAGLRAFRTRYPEGLNLVVAGDVDEPYSRHYGALTVRFVSIEGMVRAVGDGGQRA